MNSLSKWLFAVLFLTIINLLAQEQVQDSIVKIQAATFFELHAMQPIYYGENFISEGYDVSNAVQIGVTYQGFLKHLSLHFNIGLYSGRVERPEIVGFFESSQFTRVSAGVGYPFKITDKLSLTPSLHYGYVKLGHKLREGEFSVLENEIADDGSFIALEGRAHYAVVEWLEISLGVTNYFDRLRIEVPDSQGQFFNRSNAIAPFLGVRFRINSW